MLSPYKITTLHFHSWYLCQKNRVTFCKVLTFTYWYLLYVFCFRKQNMCPWQPFLTIMLLIKRNAVFAKVTCYVAASFPVVLGDFRCDVTCLAFWIVRTRFQASLALSDSLGTRLTQKWNWSAHAGLRKQITHNGNEFSIFFTTFNFAVHFD